MTRWTVLAIAAVANVIAVVAIVAALWWGGVELVPQRP